MPCPHTEDETFAQQMDRIFAVPPEFTKLEAWAKDWAAIEAQERADEAAELDRRRMDRSDAVWAADRDDGEEEQVA